MIHHHIDGVEPSSAGEPYFASGWSRVLPLSWPAPTEPSTQNVEGR